jgi:hypothetical protein
MINDCSALASADPSIGITVGFTSTGLSSNVSGAIVDFRVQLASILAIDRLRVIRPNITASLASNKLKFYLAPGSSSDAAALTLAYSLRSMVANTASALYQQPMLSRIQSSVVMDIVILNTTTNCLINLPCYTGTTCVDEPTPVCGYCPTGYLEGDGINCIEYNACTSSSVNPCGVGVPCYDDAPPSVGYTCGCADGYEQSTIGGVCTVKQCSTLSVPTYGSYSCSSSTQFGSTCTFVCDPGFQLSHSVPLSCNASALWSQPTPSCSPKQCYTMTNTPTGTWSCTNGGYGIYAYNSVCTLTCQYGTVLSGSNVRTCISTGEWSGVNGTCVINSCGQFPAPVASHGVYVDGGLGIYNSLANYSLSCNAGYVLVSPLSSSNFTCNTTGTWVPYGNVSCIDYNACISNTCYPGVNCTDNAAPDMGYTCGACPTGYYGNGTTCYDIDGCSELPCPSGVACHDVPAPGIGRVCDACPTGTIANTNGTLCLEIDGCASSPCSSLTTCTDVPSPGTGFTCSSCPFGYGGDGITCLPCPGGVITPCGGFGSCTLVNNIPTCQCNSGYHGYICTSPSIVSGTPLNGITNGGYLLTLTGHLFTGSDGAANVTMLRTLSTGVNITQSCQIIDVTSTLIRCMLPASIGGTWSVTVTRTSDNITSNVIQFQYDSPVITSMVPSSGAPAGGGYVQLLGRNFGANLTNGIYNISSGFSIVIEPGLHDFNHTCIWLLVPRSNIPTLPIYFTANDIVTNTLTYSYYAPKITSVFGQVGLGCVADGNGTKLCPTSGGGYLTIYGQYFGFPTTSGSPVTVTVGGTTCGNLILLIAQTTIRCDLPAGYGRPVYVKVDRFGSSDVQALLSYTSPYAANNSMSISPSRYSSCTSPWPCITTGSTCTCDSTKVVLHDTHTEVIGNGTSGGDVIWISGQWFTANITNTQVSILCVIYCLL